MKNIFTENIDKYGIINFIIILSIPIIALLVIAYTYNINFSNYLLSDEVTRAIIEKSLNSSIPK